MHLFLLILGPASLTLNGNGIIHCKTTKNVQSYDAICIHGVLWMILMAHFIDGIICEMAALK